MDDRQGVTRDEVVGFMLAATVDLWMRLLAIAHRQTTMVEDFEAEV